MKVDSLSIHRKLSKPQTANSTKLPQVGNANINSKPTTASKEGSETKTFSLPEGFNGDTNIEDKPLTLDSINSLFQLERAKLAQFQKERTEFNARIEALEEANKASILECSQKEHIIKQFQDELDDAKKRFQQQLNAMTNLEKQHLETRLKLQNVQQEYDRLDKLSQDFNLIRDQRDALVRALETASKEKQQLVDKLAAEKNKLIALESQQIAKTSEQAKPSSLLSSVLKRGTKGKAETSEGDKQVNKKSQSASVYGSQLEQEFSQVNVIDIPPEINVKALKHYEKVYETQRSLIQHEKSHLLRLNLTELQDGYKSALGRLEQREQKILHLEQNLNAKPNEIIVLTSETPTQLAIKKQETDSLVLERDNAQKQVAKEKERYEQLNKQLFELQEKFALTQKQLAEQASQIANKNQELLLVKTNSAREKMLLEDQHKLALKGKEEMYDSQSKVLLKLQEEFDKMHSDFILQTKALSSKKMEDSRLLIEASKKQLAELEKCMAERDELKTTNDELAKRNNALEKQVLNAASLETVNKTLTTGLAKITAEKCQLQLEVDRLENAFEIEKDLFKKNTSQLETFVFTLKQKLSMFLEVENGIILEEKSSATNIKKPQEQEKNLQTLIKKDIEALVINEAFIDKAKKDKDANVVKRLSLEKDKLEALKKHHEESLLAFYESQKVQETLSSELSALKQFKAQYSGLVSTVSKAQQANKVVLVTPQGIVTTTIADLKKELLNVNHKREEAELDIPLPPNWSRDMDPDGRVFYQLTLPNGSRKSQWTHPSSTKV